MKQFVLICDEKGMEAISRVCNGTVQFLEVYGMNIPDNPFMIMTTPILPVIEKVDAPATDLA